MLARIEQFADVMHDSKCQIKKVPPSWSLSYSSLHFRLSLLKSVALPVKP